MVKSASAGRPRVAAQIQEECCDRSGRLRPRATRGFVQLFRALGDATRLEIVGLLSAGGRELCG